MMQRTVARRFLGSFTSGFSKGFFGGARGAPSGLSGNAGSGSSSPFSNKGGSSGGTGSGIFSGFGGGSGGLPPGGPLGELLDKALEWCSESHARDIASEMGVDLRDIRFEKTPEGGMNVMVDAPMATPLQIEQLGKRVQEECPVARFRKTQVSSPKQEMKWLQLPPRYDR
ncbi:hypothetical protein LSCM1_07863 [Leishmania martiniquensis]|uniref:Uncharacterized protein n=1 Tax=Leishmania martiniquensis TaxID=1580590 RepID=A0A836KSY6_9TRYP|nr:hypothetical protein LSCM1_07863 [Leishmania martiniquensis]